MSNLQPQQPPLSSKTKPTTIPHDETSRSSSSRSDTLRGPSANQYPIPSIESPLAGATPWTNAAQPPPSPLPPRFRVPESPRSGSGDQPNKIAKIAIPRLKRATDEGTNRQGGRHRVTHACEPCRHRKTKCSGERPICRHCQDFKIACYYADGKRDRVKKQFGSMTEKVTEYEGLLKDLLGRVNASDVKMIKAALEKDAISDTIPDFPDDSTVATPNGQDNESGDESDVSAGAGSTGALDRTDEDFTRGDAMTTGFMGKNSEVTWLQRLRQQNKFGDDQAKNARPGSLKTDLGSESSTKQASTCNLEEEEGFSVKDNSYHLDDQSVLTYDTVDPYEVPTPDMAQHLFDAFMRKVHPSFPITGRLNLTVQFRKFVSGQVQRPPEKWLAIINMIFAIGAKYSHCVQADWQGDDRDHLIYFTRARHLSMNGETLFQHPDLQQIQIWGLTSFYFLTISQINRAWMFVGLAIRAATALGMNVRNESTKLKDSLKEIRYRAWWALYALEHRLSSMTGRVNCILDEHCTAPIPIPLEEEKFDTEEGVRLLSQQYQQGQRGPQSNSHTPSVNGSTPSTDRSKSARASVSRSVSTSQGADSWWAKDASPNASLYFLHRVQLSRLTQNMCQKLYNATTVDGSWSDVQGTIGDLNNRLEVWYHRLPTVFDFRRNQRDREYYEFRLSLGFFYYDTRITINRPCLCRLDRKMPNQSDQSAEFNRNSATMCVEAAQEMLRLIPDEPNPIGLMRVGPWWCMLHWIVQAAVVLMLEMSFRVQHMPQEAQNIAESSRKAVKWLHALGDDNLSAARAWTLCNGLLHEAAGKIGVDLRDLPTKLPGRASVSTEGNHHPMSGMMHTTNMPGGGMYTSGQLNSALYTGTGGLSDFALNYDQMMRYDQYFPGANTVDDQMQYQSPISGGQMRYMDPPYDSQPGAEGGGSSRFH